MPGTDFQVIVRMTTPTVRALAGAGYALYAFAPVESSGTATRPLVWLRKEDYAPTTVVAWSGEWEAFTATVSAAAITNAPLVPGFSAPVAPGEMLRVDGAGGTGPVVAGAFPGRVAVLSAVTQPYACGLSQRDADGDYGPVCTLPLYGGALQLLSAPPAVLLMFSTVYAQAGTPAGAATGPGVLLDLAGAPAATVGFDVDTGWTWDADLPGKAVPAATDLAPLLVRPLLPSGLVRITAGASVSAQAGVARALAMARGQRAGTAGTPAAAPGHTHNQSTGSYV